MPTTTPTRSPSPLAKVVAGLCLAAPFVGLLAVPLYTRDEPRIGGFPFFFWYQLVWVLVSAVLTSCAYLLVGRKGHRS